MIKHPTARAHALHTLFVGAALGLAPGCAADDLDAPTAESSSALTSLDEIYGRETELPLCSVRPPGFHCSTPWIPPPYPCHSMPFDFQCEDTPPPPGHHRWSCDGELDQGMMGSFFLSRTWGVLSDASLPAAMSFAGAGGLAEMVNVDCRTEGQRHATVAVPSGSGDHTVATVDGFVDHPSEGLVRGTVEVHRGAQVPARSGDVVLAIQVFDGSLWKDVKTATRTSSTTAETHQLTATVAPGSDVRFEVRVARFAGSLPQTKRVYRLDDLRLFAQTCVPDAADPTKCL